MTTEEALREISVDFWNQQAGREVKCTCGGSRCDTPWIVVGAGPTSTCSYWGAEVDVRKRDGCDSTTCYAEDLELLP